jgi:hypothetical protein
VEEVPRPERPLLALDQQQALAGEDEEVLLGRLGVVQGARPAGGEHHDPDPDLRESANLELRPRAHRRRAGFEAAAGAERVVPQPGGIPHVDDEPALLGRHQARVHRFKTCLSHRVPSWLMEQLLA